MRKTVVFGLLMLQAMALSSFAHAANIAGVVTNVSKATGSTEQQAEASVKAVFAAIEQELQAGRVVTVRNFGRFYVKERAARMGRNPKTGQAIQIPAKKYPRFTSSDNLKAAMNK